MVGLYFLVKSCKREGEVTSRYRVENEPSPAELVYQRVLESSPVSLYDQSLNIFAQAACPICLLPFTTGQRIRKTVCMHICHKACIESWIKAKANQVPTCPTCNLNLINNSDVLTQASAAQSNVQPTHPPENNTTQSYVLNGGEQDVSANVIE